MSRAESLLFFQFVPAGWIYAQEVFDEEVGAFVFAEVLAHGVVGTRDEDELEVLVGLDEGVDDLVGGGGRQGLPVRRLSIRRCPCGRCPNRGISWQRL